MAFALKGKFAPIVLAALLSASPLVTSSASGQSAAVSQLPFKTFDVRGKGEAFAEIAAGTASNKAYIVLLVRGNDPAIIKNAEEALLGVYRTGRERVVLIKGDGNSKLLHVVADGLPFSFDDKADGTVGTKAAAVESLIEAYDKFVVPKIKAAPKQDLDKK